MIQGFNTFSGKYFSELFMFVIHSASFPFLKGISLLLAEILKWSLFTAQTYIFSHAETHERIISLFSLIHQQYRPINTIVNEEN